MVAEGPMVLALQAGGHPVTPAPRRGRGTAGDQGCGGLCCRAAERMKFEKENTISSVALPACRKTKTNKNLSVSLKRHENFPVTTL